MNHIFFYHILANMVMSLHFAIVFFVVGGLAVIIIGGLIGWHLTHSLWFRLTHLAVVAVVVAQAWLGAVCPLTTLEMWLRARAGESTYTGSFIKFWLHRVLYYDAPLWVFAIAYSGFAIIVLATWWCFPPESNARGEDA